MNTTGRGIPPEVLKRLGESGFTSGKDGINSGFGLGIPHALKLVRKWGGSLKIESEKFRGTSVSISLPLCTSPAWFVAELEIPQDSRVTIVDYDRTAFEIWRQRFSKNWITEVCFYSSLSEAASGGIEPQNRIFLVDGQIFRDSLKRDGGDIARFRKENVILLCDSIDMLEPHAFHEFGFKLLPRALIASVPITRGKKAEVILIDDDRLIHEMWMVAARRFSKKVSCYCSFEEFLKHANDISHTSQVYIDLNLGAGSMSGLQVAYDVHKLGFQNIFISTGMRKEDVVVQEWVKGIVGKEVPWI